MHVPTTLRAQRRTIGHKWIALKEWLRRRGLLEIAILGSLLTIVASSWAFIALADEVLEGDTRHFDEWVLRSLRSTEDPSTPIGPRAMLQVAEDITALGGFAVVTLVTAGVAGYLCMRRKWGAMCLVLAAIVGGGLASEALKQVFQRPRPSVVPHLAVVHSMSFPSGHSMLSAVTYLTLGALLAKTAADRRGRIYLLGVAITVTFLVGLSRIYLGVHYPTDVLAGWCAGIVWALLCSLVARWLQKRGAVEKGADSTG